MDNSEAIKMTKKSLDPRPKKKILAAFQISGFSIALYPANYASSLTCILPKRYITLAVSRNRIRRSFSEFVRQQLLGKKFLFVIRLIKKISKSAIGEALTAVKQELSKCVFL